MNEINERSLTAAKFGYATAVFFVVVGGLLSAVTGPLSIEKGSWLAAFVVLILGVSTGILAKQHELIDGDEEKQFGWTLYGTWVLGCLLTIVGALTSLPFVAIAGGALLWIALIFALKNSGGAGRPWRALILRVVYIILLISIPIGLVLTYFRALAATV